MASKRFDSWGQFSKLFPSYSRSIDMLKGDQLLLVEHELKVMIRLSNNEYLPHWAYDLNRHQALVELRDALKEEMKEMA